MSIQTQFTDNPEANSTPLCFAIFKKPDGYNFKITVDSETGVLGLDVGNAAQNLTTNSVRLVGNSTITLTFANMKESGNALLNLYLNDTLASSVEMKSAWRTNDSLTANLLAGGFGADATGVAVTASGARAYSGVVLPVPEPATATLS